MCVSCLVSDGNFNPTGAMQELLMLPRRCAELGASWCPGLRTVYVVAQAIVWKSPRCRGQLLSWSRVFLLVPSLWGSAHACGCEYTARVLFLIQNDDLELVGLCFIGNVEWGLLKPILKHPKLLSSALIWRNNKFFKTKWQCSFFFFFCNKMVTPRHYYFQLCCYIHTLC